MRIKHYEVDIDDIVAIRKTINQLKAAAGALTENNRRKASRDRLDAATAILDTDIDHIYAGIPLSEHRKFYVYAHCDGSRPIRAGVNPVSFLMASLGATHRPFYIGKGTGDRAFDLNRNGLHRKVKQKIVSLGFDVVPIVLKTGLTELEALTFEAKLIDIIGVSGKAGTLANHDEGAFAAERRSLYIDHLAVLNKINAIC